MSRNRILASRRAVIGRASDSIVFWNYSENIRFEPQLGITPWAWAESRNCRREESGQRDDGAPEEAYLVGGEGRQG